jgi:uncharacterized membrane protein
VNADPARHPGLELLLAKVLHRGTWLGASVIATGLALQLAGWQRAPLGLTNSHIITAGIALLILLPVLRVLLMLFVFVRERDNHFSIIATLVLAIIVSGALLGMHEDGAMPASSPHAALSPPNAIRSRPVD